MGAHDRGRDQGCDALEDPTAQPRRPSGRRTHAAPALTAIAAVLRNDSISVSREAIDAVRAFMTDGVDSPLYGRDPLAASRGADALRHRLAGSRQVRVERDDAVAGRRPAA